LLRIEFNPRTREGCDWSCDIDQVDRSKI